MCVFWDLATRSRYLTRRQAGGTRECGNGYNRWWTLVLLDHGTVVCETQITNNTAEEGSMGEEHTKHDKNIENHTNKDRIEAG